MLPQPFPPPAWPFAPSSTFDTEESSYAKEKSLGVEVLMRFERTVATDVIVRTGGSTILRPSWPAEAVLGDKFREFRMVMEVWPADLVFKANLASTDWMDVAEAVSADTIAVLVNGVNDEEKLLLAGLRSDSEKKAIGGALRWCMVIGDTGRLELMLQALPLPREYVASKPILRADSSPVISLAAYQLEYVEFDGVLAAGPVPTICCADADRATINASPESLHGQMQKLASLFAKPETVGFREAEKVCKKPRIGNIELSFKRKYKKVSSDAQPAKRPRTELSDQGEQSRVPPSVQ
jgi:hypothetical protein